MKVQSHQPILHTNIRGRRTGRRSHSFRKTSQARTTQADTQEETLQLESSETEDTSVKKVDIPRDQMQDPHTRPTEVQNTSDIDDQAVPDSNCDQTEDNGMTP